MSNLEAVATASVSPRDALRTLRSLIADASGPAKAEAAELAYEALRSVVWQHVSGRTEGDGPRAWADVVLRIRQSLRLAKSPVAERLTALYDMLDQTVRFRDSAVVRAATTGGNVEAILLHLRGQGGSTPRASIAEATGIRSSNLSRILANMCAEGLVTRSSRGREVVVSLASEGHSRLGHAQTAGSSISAEAVVAGAAARATVRDLWPSTGCALAVTNRDGILVSCDLAFSSLFGAEEASLEGFTHEQIRARLEDVGEQFGNGALEGRTPDGRTLRVTTHSAAQGTLWLGVDVTPYKDALSESRAQVRDLTQKKRRVHMASHHSREEASARWALEVLKEHGPEFVQGVNAVNGYAELMRTQAFGPLIEPRYVDYVNEIVDRSTHLRDFMKDIVWVAGINGHIPEVQAQIVPARVIEAALSRAAGISHSSSTAFHVGPVMSPPVVANADAADAIVSFMIGRLATAAHPGALLTIGSHVEGKNLIFHALTERGFKSSRSEADFTTICRGLADVYGGDFHVIASKDEGLTTNLAIPIGKLVRDTRR